MEEIRPQPKQEKFLSTPADIAIYGGAAGGGKTWSLLMEPLRHIKTVRNFGAVIFRRTVPEITNEGGLWDEACELYPNLGGIPISGTHHFRFPPYGNTISFHGLEEENDVLKWHSSQICLLEFDELTTFSERQFWYMFSRNRSTCGVRPYIRCGCNPAPNWVKTSILAPWVDEEWEGERAQSGQILWFIRLSGKIQWVPEGTKNALSVTYIPASVYDNKRLIEKDPGYIPKLEAQDPVQRARLLEGDWRVMYEGLVYPEAFDPQYEVIVERESRPQKPNVGGMDYGVRNAFAAPWGYVDHEDVLWIVECYYRRGMTIPQHSPNLPLGVRWWVDPAGAEERMQLKQAGHDVVACGHMPARRATGETQNPKSAGISVVRERMRTKRLKIVRPKCRELIRELGLYVYDATKPEQEEPVKKDDHSPDALRYLVVGHDRGREVSSIWRKESDLDRQAREKAEVKARFESAREADLAAQANLMDDRWWNA